MRKVTTMSQIQAHKLITRIQDCQKYSSISLSTRVRLNVCPFSTEDFLQTFDSDTFALVYYFAATVITFAWIAFCIFIGQARTHGLHNLVTYKIFGSNQFNAFQLTLMFLLDNIKNQIVSFHIFD